MGGAQGIHARNEGLGSIAITSAAVSASSALSAGILAEITLAGATGNLMIDSSIGAISGAARGIQGNMGTGPITITSIGHRSEQRRHLCAPRQCERKRHCDGDFDRGNRDGRQ